MRFSYELGWNKTNGLAPSAWRVAQSLLCMATPLLQSQITRCSRIAFGNIAQLYGDCRKHTRFALCIADMLRQDFEAAMCRITSALSY